MIYFDNSLEKHISKYLYIFKPEDIHFGLEYLDLSHPSAVWVLPKDSPHCTTVTDLGDALVTVEFDDENQLIRDDLKKILALKSVELQDNAINFEDIIKGSECDTQSITYIEKSRNKELFGGYLDLNNVTVLARQGVPSIELAKFACEQIDAKPQKYCIIDLDILPTFGAKCSGESVDEVRSMVNAKKFSDITPMFLTENIMYFFGTSESGKMVNLLCEDWGSLVSYLDSKYKIQDYKVVVLLSLESMFTGIYRAFTRNNEGYVLISDMSYIKEVAMKTSGCTSNTTVLIDLHSDKVEPYQKAFNFGIKSLRLNKRYRIVV